MRPLTARQTEVLELIKTTMQETGMPPTRAEIARQLGFRSANAAEEHLKALARKGVIEILPGTSRGIKLNIPLDNEAEEEEATDEAAEQMGFPEKSPGGQFMPFNRLDKWNPKKDGTKYTCDELKNPELNIRVGARALKRWSKRSGGDTPTAICAYNAGNICFKRIRTVYLHKVERVFYTLVMMMPMNR